MALNDYFKTCHSRATFIILYDCIESTVLALTLFLLYNADRREAIPKFIRKPRTCTVTEGQSAKFDCKIIAASPPVVTW